MKAPQPSLTHEWHNNTYAAISPTRPALSAAHKTIIVTGAGSGIGRETVRAYATAGAARIALLGRTLTTLSETKIMVEGEFGATRVSTHVVDIVDEHKLRDVAQDVGHWDVLVLNAGLGMKPAMIAEADVNVWWRVFEVCIAPFFLQTCSVVPSFGNTVTHSKRMSPAAPPLLSTPGRASNRPPSFQTNVKGSMVTAHVFLATRKSSAVIISNSAATISVPNTTPISIGSSAYIASKMAQLKLIEHIAAENTDIIAVSVHPGAIETKLLEVFEANVPHLDDGEF